MRGIFRGLSPRATVLSASVAMVLIHGLLLPRLARDYAGDLLTFASVCKWVVFAVIAGLFLKNMVVKGGRFTELAKVDYALILALGVLTVGEFFYIYVNLAGSMGGFGG